MGFVYKTHNPLVCGFCSFCSILFDLIFLVLMALKNSPATAGTHSPTLTSHFTFKKNKTIIDLVFKSLNPCRHSKQLEKLWRLKTSVQSVTIIHVMACVAQGYRRRTLSLKLPSLHFPPNLQKYCLVCILSAEPCVSPQALGPWVAS